MTARDEALVRKALAGSREAFSQLVRTYEAQAFATALSFLGQHADARDAVQEAFITAYCKLDQLREPERFGNWLRAIVRSIALQQRRRRERAPRFAYVEEQSLEAVGSMTVPLDDETGDAANLWKAVGMLPQVYREAILLRYDGGLSYREIADTLDLPVSTVKGRLQQGLEKLRVALGAKERIMRKESVYDEVMTAVCRIAREQIAQEIPLGEARRVVLYCFAPTSVQVTGADRNAVVLSGTKLAVGHTEDEARANLSEIQLRSDEVEDWSAAGPHRGEAFCGTNTDLDGKPTAMVRQVSELPPKGYHSEKGTLESLYPEMHPRVREALHDAQERMQGGATRITVLWEHVKDIVVTGEARDKVWEAFVPNWIESQRSHGQAGRVELHVGIPAGTEVIIVAHPLASELKAEGLRCDMFVSGMNDACLRNIEGAVHVHNGSVQLAEGIRGEFMLDDYSFGGAEGIMCRHRVTKGRETVLRNVWGEVRVDVGNRDVAASGLRGHVQIRNRFGTTHLEFEEHVDDSRYAVESDSGDVVVRMKEDLFGRMAIVLHSICGELDFEDLADLDRAYPANDLQIMTVSNIPIGRLRAELDKGLMPADLYVKTRDGRVTVEKMDGRG